ncbi:glycosyltransferase family 39 protein [Alphaproteobacteria bacterium]|nr:glycosyltransferase family 39 protein [Alphaproteobacteria bacterium]
MTQATYIFLLAFLVRLLNLYFNQINDDSYLTEDQLMYWNWSLKNAYTANSSLDPKLLLERMPGSFLFFQFAMWIVGKSLFNVLVIQIFLDSITCIIIAFIARTLNKNLFILAGTLSALSPLMIIISSQILSDTIFLFFFSIAILCLLIFTQYKKEYSIYLGALFLGLALSTRAVVLPIIFFSLLLIIFISYRNNFSFLKISRIISIFIILSFALVLPRVLNNHNNFNTFSLTSQSGSHFAYWVLPAILDFDSEYKQSQYKERLEGLKKNFNKDISPFQQSEKLKIEAFNFLLDTEKKLILLAWSKGVILNILSPPFVIDTRFRSLPHPSFYGNSRNLKQWLAKIFNKIEYKNYMILLCISGIFSLCFLILFLYGLYLICKNHFQTATIFIIIGLYFLIVTGPVYSPKYIHPILPMLIILEALSLKIIFEVFIKNIKNTKSH